MRGLLLALALLAFATPVASGAERPGILYAADARTATVTGSGAALRIALPAASSTAWFTDRPARRAGTTTLAGLVAVWQGSGFDADPPNAALLLTTRGRTTTHVVTLTDPRHARGLVSFRLRPVPGGTEAGHHHAGLLAPGRYGAAQLFVDDGGWPPCGSTVPPWQCQLAPASTAYAFPAGDDPYRVCALAAQPGSLYSTGDRVTYAVPPCGSGSVAVTVSGRFTGVATSGSSFVNVSPATQTASGETSAPSLLIG